MLQLKRFLDHGRPMQSMVLINLKLSYHLISKIGIRVRNIWSSHRLFINNEISASYGKLATAREASKPSNPVYEVYFSPSSDSVILTIQVADFHNARHGIIFPIDIGDAGALAKDVIQDVYLEKQRLSCY